MAKRKGLRTTPLPSKGSKVRMAGGQATEVSEYVPNLRIDRDSWFDAHSFVVVPGLSHPMILGMDWGKKWNPCVELETGELRMPAHERVWQCVQPEEGIPGEEAKMSAHAISKLRKRDPPGVYLVSVA